MSDYDLMSALRASLDRKEKPMKKPSTTAPTWHLDNGCIYAPNRLLVTRNSATDDEMRLMAAALDLREALRKRLDYHDEGERRRYRFIGEGTGKCECAPCSSDRALLAALPVLPHTKEEQ